MFISSKLINLFRVLKFTNITEFFTAFLNRPQWTLPILVVKRSIFPPSLHQCSDAMATPSKLPKEASSSQQGIQGYFHDISPVKTSKNNNRYFNAKFQDSESFIDVVCYRTELQEQMAQLEKNRQVYFFDKSIFQMYVKTHQSFIVNTLWY